MERARERERAIYIYIYRYIYIYIYVLCVYNASIILLLWYYQTTIAAYQSNASWHKHSAHTTANLPTNIVGFRGFVSNIILI